MVIVAQFHTQASKPGTCMLFEAAGLAATAGAPAVGKPLSFTGSIANWKDGQ